MSPLSLSLSLPSLLSCNNFGSFFLACILTELVSPSVHFFLLFAECFQRSCPPSGELQNNHSALRQAVAAERSRIARGTNASAAGELPLRICIPGGIQEAGPGFRLNILRLSDGRQNITAAAKSFAEAVSSGTASSAGLTPDEFSGLLATGTSPDLVLKFGTDDFLHGLLPWQIRVSEILKIRTHKHILLRTFIASFRQFGACNRRYGK